MTRRRPDELTPREAEVLALIKSGLKNHQIASKFSIGKQAVKNYRYRIGKKLDLRMAAELKRYAASHGIGATK